MMVMLYGMLNLAALITDKVAGAYAARQGARLAAVLGNGGASGLNTLQIDQNVCQADAPNRTMDFTQFWFGLVAELYRYLLGSRWRRRSGARRRPVKKFPCAPIGVGGR